MKATEVFNPADFKSFQFTVTFQNLTTRTGISERGIVSLLEIGDKRVVLELPPKCCAPRHSVMIQIERPAGVAPAPKKIVKGARPPRQLFEPLVDATGKVLEVEEADDGKTKVLVELVQFDEASWRAFLAIFSRRQDEIEQFFKAARG